MIPSTPIALRRAPTTERNGISPLAYCASSPWSEAGKNDDHEQQKKVIQKREQKCEFMSVSARELSTSLDPGILKPYPGYRFKQEEANGQCSNERRRDRDDPEQTNPQSRPTTSWQIRDHMGGLSYSQVSIGPRRKSLAVIAPAAEAMRAYHRH